MEDRFVQRYGLLLRLGLRADTAVFFHTAYAVLLCAEQPFRRLLAARWVYPEAARFHHTNPETVERSVQRASQIIWKENRALLEELAGRVLEEAPCGGQLLSILAGALERGPWAA